MVNRLCAGLLLLGATFSAHAETYQGTGRISLLPSYRLGLNETFYQSAAALGSPRASGFSGGPGFILSCAYAATNNLEVSIDPFLSTEQLHLNNSDDVRSWVYGALIGGRAHLFLGDFMPFAGLHTGPILVYAGAPPGMPYAEAFAQAFAVTAGTHYRFAEHWGLMAQYEFLYGGELDTALGRIHGKGHWFSVGITYFLARDTSQDGRSSGGM